MLVAIRQCPQHHPFHCSAGRLPLLLVLGVVLTFSGCARPVDAEPSVLELAEDEIGPRALAELLDAGEVFLLDVRRPMETRIATIEGGTLIPLHTLADRMDELPSDQPIVIYCRTGVRSRTALTMVQAAGHTDARHLHGGIHAWIDEVDPSLRKY